jgi:hypothetical protein
VKFVPDLTHRFTQRPHYEPRELDLECEDVISKFLQERYGAINFPILTGDLTLLIEGVVEDFDSAADLSALGNDVEGVTDFFRGKRPSVRIASHLWEGPARENRLRTTLAHEFFHVHFHNYLYQVEARPELFSSVAGGAPLRCNRETIRGQGSCDWMEWQAQYGMGALLMPITALRATVSEVLGERALGASVSETSAEGLILMDRIASRFQVSKDAARVRLSQLGHFADPRALPLGLGFTAN